MNPLKTLGLLLLCCGLMLRFAHAEPKEVILTDSQGMKAYLYTPANPDPTKTYWLVVGVHGAGGTGKGAMGLASWADKGEILVLGPSFSMGGGPQPQTNPPAPPGPPADMQNRWKASYQMSGPLHSAKLRELVAQIGKTWKIHPKVYLHGFSAGAQFVHRFAFQHPEMVLGVSAHSAGSWAKPDGDDKINPAAKNIPFVLSCGEADKGSGGPNTKLTRIEGCRAFADDLKSLGFSVVIRTWPDVAHKFTPEAEKLAWEGFEKARTAQLQVQFGRCLTPSLLSMTHGAVPSF